MERRGFWRYAQQALLMHHLSARASLFVKSITGGLVCVAALRAPTAWTSRRASETGKILVPSLRVECAQISALSSNLTSSSHKLIILRAEACMHATCSRCSKCLCTRTEYLLRPRTAGFRLKSAQRRYTLHWTYLSCPLLHSSPKIISCPTSQPVACSLYT